jgi:hypothetical protein
VLTDLRFKSGAALPVVTCPGCQRAMTPLEKKPNESGHDMVDVTYRCEACDFMTTRSVRDE